MITLPCGQRKCSRFQVYSGSIQRAHLDLPGCPSAPQGWETSRPGKAIMGMSGFEEKASGGPSGAGV